MNSKESASGNARKLQRLRQVIEQELPQVLTPRFFGNFTIKLSIQDGTIQNIRHKVERIDK